MGARAACHARGADATRSGVTAVGRRAVVVSLGTIVIRCVPIAFSTCLMVVRSVLEGLSHGLMIVRRVLEGLRHALMVVGILLVLVSRGLMVVSIVLVIVRRGLIVVTTRQRREIGLPPARALHPRAGSLTRLVDCSFVGARFARSLEGSCRVVVGDLRCRRPFSCAGRSRRARTRRCRSV
jgi:hypothetical protein